MRMMVFFDLPVTSASERKAATQFRNFLIKDGYYMLQFSVYSRVCNSDENVQTHIARLKDNLPALKNSGSVRLMVVTEKQYQNMHILIGKISTDEKPFQVEQLTFI